LNLSNLGEEKEKRGPAGATIIEDNAKKVRALGPQERTAKTKNEGDREKGGGEESCIFEERGRLRG